MAFLFWEFRSWVTFYTSLFPVLYFFILLLSLVPLQIISKKARETKRKIIVPSMQIFWVGGVCLFSLQFGYIKTLSEHPNKKINFYITDTTSNEVIGKCTYRKYDNRFDSLYSFPKSLISDKMIYSRPEIGNKIECKEFGSFDVALVFPKESMIADYAQEINSNNVSRAVASKEDEKKADDLIISDDEKTIRYEDFLVSVSLYTLIAFSFFLAVSKFWYESSSALYRHFNDQFVECMLEFNKENNIEIKKAYAERLFQLLKEEYLIFYKHNFVYSLGRKEESYWGLKFWKNNILYALGTNQYLDEWFTMMKSISEEIHEGQSKTLREVELEIYLGNNKLKKYFFYIYLDRIKELKEKEGNSYSEDEKQEHISLKDKSGFLNFIYEAHKPTQKNEEKKAA